MSTKCCCLPTWRSSSRPGPADGRSVNPSPVGCIAVDRSPRTIGKTWRHMLFHGRLWRDGPVVLAAAQGSPHHWDSLRGKHTVNWFILWTWEPPVWGKMVPPEDEDNNQQQLDNFFPVKPRDLNRMTYDWFNRQLMLENLVLGLAGRIWNNVNSIFTPTSLCICRVFFLMWVTCTKNGQLTFPSPVDEFTFIFLNKKTGNSRKQNNVSLLTY